VQTSGKWYYLGEDGAMIADDYIEIKDKWYGFDKNGAMAANGWYEKKFVFEDGSTDSIWFYAGADGAFVKGWKQIGGKWYYFLGTQKTDKEGYVPCMVTGLPYIWDESGAVSWFDSGLFYGFKPSGEMIVGWGRPYADSKYFYEQHFWVYGNNDGSLLTKTWKKIGGKWYYFAENGRMYWNGTGTTYDKNDKNVYLFNDSGALVENGWYRPYWKYDDGTVDYDYWYYGGKDGVVQKGWVKDKGNWYYLNAEYGYMETGLIEMSDGKTYYLDETTGAMATGWKKLNDIWYYFKDSGAMAVKEWVKSGSAWYYLKDDGQMAKDEILTIDGKPYKFDSNGVWVP
jgi:glucan-binding YG repeat protein